MLNGLLVMNRWKHLSNVFVNRGLWRSRCPPWTGHEPSSLAASENRKPSYPSSHPSIEPEILHVSDPPEALHDVLMETDAIDLEQAIGHEAAKKLFAAFGGSDLVVPRRIESESRLLAQAFPEMQPGPLATPDGTEFGRVFQCMAPRQPGRPSGMLDFFSKTVWLDRSTCPHADACKFAATCGADGRHPGLATHSIA